MIPLIVVKRAVVVLVEVGVASEIAGYNEAGGSAAMDGGRNGGTTKREVCIST